MDAEHEAFLRGMGWRPDMPKGAKARLEAEWADPQDREMARALGF